MAVIYSREECSIPVAMVDRYFPGEQELRGTLERFQICKLTHPMEESSKEVAYRFEAISERINDYLGENGYAGVEHFCLFRRRAYDKSRDPKRTLQTSFPSLDHILSEDDDANYCMNIIADPEGDGSLKLKTYVLFWTAVTGFQMKADCQYRDFDSHRKACDDLCLTVERLYHNPLTSILGDQGVGTKCHYYKIHTG